MEIYLKFGDERKTVEEIEEIMYSGNIEASKCLGNYFAKKRKLDNINNFRCISYYLHGAKLGCPECMVKVSKYSLEYARIISEDNKNLKLHYISLSAEYAFKAFCNANTKQLRKSSLDCLMYSNFLVEENIDLLKSYLIDIEQ